jgi:hypothetical protein
LSTTLFLEIYGEERHIAAVVPSLTEPETSFSNADMQQRNTEGELKTLYLPAVTAMADRWAEGKPLNPDSGRANGYYRLSAWLLDYLVRHNAMPAGVHEMPEGRDRHGRIEPSFPVDFDPLADGIHLPDR